MEMAKLMSNLTAATRLGQWYVFGNLKRYHTLHICLQQHQILQIPDADALWDAFTETNYPEVYQQFVEGNFTVQLSGKNTFGIMEPDMVNNILIPKAIVM